MSLAELRRQIHLDVKNLVDGITKELREAEEMDRGIDLTEFIHTMSETYSDMNQHFEEAELRGRQNPKKFF